MKPIKAFLFKKTTLFLPTCSFSLLLLLLLISGVVFSTVNIYSFLAVTKQIDSEAIIIEGWLPDYCFKEAVEFIRQHSNQYILVTGGPLEKGSFLSEYSTYAHLGKATLLALDVPDSLITVIPAAYSKVDRTYASALALKKWLHSRQNTYTTLTILSEGTHTRRSYLLFKKALGPKYLLGSKAIASRDYTPELWWKSSSGVRSVIDETIAYLYALFFIHFR